MKLILILSLVCFLFLSMTGYTRISDGLDQSCIDIRGNADGDENQSVNISDITYLVAYCFGGGPAPLCIEEGNANGDDNETINISDVTYLVSYCFGGGPEPLPCPGTSTPAGHITDYTTCKDFTQTMAGAETPPGQDCIEYEYNGAGTLSIKHVNAGLNCCPIIVADISIEDNTILIDEIDSLDNGGCYCLCLYDIDYTITNLTPGEYRIIIVEPYLIEGDEEIDFTVDLFTNPSGSHCVTRNHYPWE